MSEFGSFVRIDGETANGYTVLNTSHCGTRCVVVYVFMQDCFLLFFPLFFLLFCFSIDFIQFVCTRALRAKFDVFDFFDVFPLLMLFLAVL